MLEYEIWNKLVNTCQGDRLGDRGESEYTGKLKSTCGSEIGDGLLYTWNNFVYLGVLIKIFN